jgi:glycosyltransferase involved in cell wall biosynthesis
MKKRILCISYTQSIGGGEIRLLTNINILKKHYNVLFLGPGGEVARRLRGKVSIIISRGVGQLERSSNRLWPWTLLKRIILSFTEISRIIRFFKPHIIYCSSETAAFYTFIPAKIYATKIVVEVCNLVPYGSVWEKISYLLGPFVYQFIVPSKTSKRRLIDIGHVPSKMLVTYTSVDTHQKFNPDNVQRGQFREKYNLPENCLLIGLIGAIYYLKGQHNFIRAISKLTRHLIEESSVIFVIVGSPRVAADLNYQKNLYTFVEKRGLTEKVFFTGHVPYEFIPNVLRDLDVLVFSSCLPDAFPRIVAEAMSMKLVVIASRLGGVIEQIQDNVTGFLYTAESSSDLAIRMEYVIRHQNVMDTIRKRARAKAIREYSQIVYAQRFETLCQTLVV